MADRSKGVDLHIDRIPNVSKSGMLLRFEQGLLKKSQQYKVILSSSMLFFYIPSQLERPKVVRGAQGDAGPQIKIDDTTVGASKPDEADDWAHMIEIAIHDPGNTAGRSLAYIGLGLPLTFARAYRLQLTGEEEEVLREKEAQYVPPPAHLAQPPTAMLSSSPQTQPGFKSPERIRVPHDDRAAAGRALSPLRETPMHRPGTVIHSGWLYRKGMMNNWKKKWFTIIGSSIYYADAKEAELMYQLPLVSDTVVKEEREFTCPECEPDCAFKLFSRRAGTTVYLSAETSSEKSHWAHEIKNAIRHVDIVYHTIVLSMLTLMQPQTRSFRELADSSILYSAPSVASSPLMLPAHTHLPPPITAGPLPPPPLTAAPLPPPISAPIPIPTSTPSTAAPAAATPLALSGKHPHTLVLPPLAGLPLPPPPLPAATSPDSTSPASPPLSPKGPLLTSTTARTAPTAISPAKGRAVSPSSSTSPGRAADGAARTFSTAQPNKVATSPAEPATALYQLWRPMGKANARFDPIKIGARTLDKPTPEEANPPPAPSGRIGLVSSAVKVEGPRATLRALEHMYAAVDAAKIGTVVDTTPSMHEGWLSQLKPSGQKLVYGTLKPGFFRYYRAVQKVKLVLDAGASVSVSRYDSSPTFSQDAALKVTIQTTNGEAQFAVDDAAECTAWVRAIEKRQNRTGWVSCLRGSGWKPSLASVHGHNFGLFTMSLKATLSLKQCNLINSDEPFSWMLISDAFGVTMKAALASDFAKWCNVLATEIEALAHKDHPSPSTPGALTVLGRRRLDQVRDVVAPFHAALPRVEDRRSNARLQLLQRQKHRPFVVLSLEASGPLDIVPAVVLDRLATAVPNFISQIDLVTGTSSASFLASCLAVGMPPSTARSLVELKAQLCHPQVSGGKEVGMQNALYDHGPLTSFLTEVFGPLSISDADRFLLLTSLEHGVGGVNVVIDHNFETPSTRILPEMLLPAMSTPIIFPTSRRGFDAGLAAPNTAANAVLMITSRFRIPFSEIIVVSLGGASRTRDLPIEESLNWGAQQWLPFLAQVSREASSRISQQLVSETCGERFIHFAPSLTDTVMYDECNVDALQKLVGESDIAPLVDFVRQRMAEL